MLKEKYVFLVPAIMLGVAVCAAEKPAPVKNDEANLPSPDLTVRRENASRQALLFASDKKIAEANKAIVNFFIVFSSSGVASKAKGSCQTQARS